jgi:hypothetical protein
MGESRDDSAGRSGASAKPGAGVGADADVAPSASPGGVARLGAALVHRAQGPGDFGRVRAIERDLDPCDRAPAFAPRPSTDVQDGMELRDLDATERVALVALVEFVGASNPEVSDEESEAIAAIADALGEESYHRSAAQADERCPDEEALRALLQEVRRQEARELILGTALEVAAGDTIQSSESELLDWLADTWGVEIEIESDESGEA